MATMPAMSLQRQKKVVRYGKAASRTSFSTMHVDDFLEDELVAPTMTAQRTNTVKNTYTVEKPVQRPAEAKRISRPIKTEKRKQDTFDVPSSEDEITSPVRYSSPPRLKSKRVLVNNTDMRDGELAPWEKRSVRASPASKRIVPRSGKASAASPETQLISKLADASTGDSFVQVRAIESAFQYDDYDNDDSHGLSSARPEPIPLSAAARLAARKKIVGGTQASTNQPAGPVTAQKRRPETLTNDTQHATRKRSRRMPPSRHDSADVTIDDAPIAPVCEAPQAALDTAMETSDVFDFPDDTSDEPPSTKHVVGYTKPASKRPRRGRLHSGVEETPKKGVSAPARLAEMLRDTESTSASSRSPSAPDVSESMTNARKIITSTEERLSSTPAGRSDSPQTAIKAAGALTPKQSQLWSQLLSSDPAVPSPSALPIKDLRIGGKRRTINQVAPFARTLTKSSSDVPEMHRRRTRLVDRLKASAPSTDEESEDESSDMEVEDDRQTRSQNDMVSTLQPKNGESQQSAASRTQSQSQTKAAVEGGPRVTYARTRSYLPEDNFEDGLLAGAPSFTPVVPRTFSREPSKSQNASQKSAFDLEESEEDSSTARMRTIHELRAAGRNKRFEQDTLALLEDISNHNVSARSRRRSALMDIATKLAERDDFSKRFLGQGFELRLVAECSAQPDEIADFVLAACFALLLAADPPEHTVTTLYEAELLPWLVRLLPNDTPISKLAKDRRNNMSKSAQGSVADFASKLQSQVWLWQESVPQTVTPRLLTLKALDQMVGRLRRAGDKTELLGAETLPAIVRLRTESGSEDLAAMTLAISTLESLSASPNILTWPEEVLGHLSAILHSLSAQGKSARHARFLAYRLILNLTNDNTRNCAALTTSETICDLLDAIADGFRKLASEPIAEQRALDLDLLVLALGVMINLAEYDESARELTVNTRAADTLTAILEIFQHGQERALEAESMEDTTTNVAYGYLAVMLANICQSADARMFVAARMPGNNLAVLIEAVEEFVAHHQRVDMLSFDGAEGREVWGAFTERLKGVLVKLKAVAEV